MELLIYAILLFAFAIIITIFVFLVKLILFIWKKLKPKGRAITFGTIGLIIAAVVVTNIAVRNYQNNLPIVSQRLDLRDYAPFTANTKAVFLEEESTLKLTENLPRLDGATALYPVYAAFVQVVYPERGYFGNNDGIVQCTTTGTAYERLLNGETDIIFVAGASEEHAQFARENGIELILTPIGKEAFVFFVNARNPVNGLTTAQIRDIYSGAITNWRDVGGRLRKILAFQRETNSGSQTAMISFMNGGRLMSPPKDSQNKVQSENPMEGMIAGVADYRNQGNAIGYSFLFFATEMAGNNQIKLLAIDGVEPTRENVANGTYPHADYFYAVSVKDSQNPNVAPFIEWILSEQGQKLIEKTGYTRVN